jgi:hypothetical protein
LKLLSYSVLNVQLQILRIFVTKWTYLYSNKYMHQNLVHYSRIKALDFFS